MFGHCLRKSIVLKLLFWPTCKHSYWNLPPTDFGSVWVMRRIHPAVGRNLRRIVWLVRATTPRIRESSGWSCGLAAGTRTQVQLLDLATSSDLQKFLRTQSAILLQEKCLEICTLLDVVQAGHIEALVSDDHLQLLRGHLREVKPGYLGTLSNV